MDKTGNKAFVPFSKDNQFKKFNIYLSRLFSIK